MMTCAPSLDPALLRRMFDTAIAAEQLALCVPPALPERPEGRLIVIGAPGARCRRPVSSTTHADRAPGVVVGGLVADDQEVRLTP